MTSKHYKKYRFKREKHIKKYMNGDGCIIEGFVIDRGDPRGAEVHSITENGVLLIHNYNTGKLVTKLILTERQLRKYYKDSEPPQYLIDLTRYHESLNYNW